MKPTPLSPALAGVILSFLLLSSCGGSEQKSMNDSTARSFSNQAPEQNRKADSAIAAPGDKSPDNMQGNTGPVSSDAAVDRPQDTAHRFIRTADLQFRTKNVRKTTYQIEDIAVRFGGFVTQSHLSSTLNYTTNTPVSADSSVETMHYTVSNNIVLRVPVSKLDTTLKSIAPLIEYLDYRNVDARDIKREELENTLRQRRIAEYNALVKKMAPAQTKTAQDATAVPDAVLAQQTKADEALLRNLELEDMLQYSTVKINLYQPQSINRRMVENDHVPESWKPGFGSELADACSGGWNILKAFIWFFFRIWPVTIGVSLGIWLLFRFLRKR